MSKPKFFTKNSVQEKPTTNRYVPEYVKRGIKPVKVDTGKYHANDLSDHSLIEDDFLEKKDMSNFYIKDSEVELPDYINSYANNEEQNEIDFDSDQDRSALDILEKSSADEFLILLDKEIFCISPKSEVEEICNDLIFGRGKYGQSEPIDCDRILILKKVSIKVGLFLQ